MKRIHRHAGDPSRIEALGPYLLESFVDRDEEHGLTAYRVEIAAHAVTATSYHARTEELYYVLEGVAAVVLDGVPRAVRAGDFIRLSPGTLHAFVTGASRLVVLNVHVPGCRPDRDTFFVGAVPEGFGGRS